MGLIATSKYGDCSFCPSTNTSVVKRGRDYYCNNCKKNADNKKQLAKQREKQQVRSLVSFQKEEGIVDSIQELIIDLDRVVSRYVRLAAMGKDHKIECFTCSRKLDWNRIHAGHFINRVHLGLRWDVTNNLRPQCPTCNITLRGNIAVFKRKLEEESKGIVEWLEETAREVAKPTKDELKQLLSHYQHKLKLVETKLTA